MAKEKTAVKSRSKVVKNATTKAINKTVVAKTTKATKTKATASITEVQGDERFFVINGQVLSTISDIPNALRNMDEYTFTYHVNSEKNDFANWVGLVFSNKTLSSKLNKAKDKEAMLQIVEKAVK